VHLVTFNKSLGYILSAVDGAINTYTNRNEKYNEKAGGKPPQALTEKVGLFSFSFFFCYEKL